MNAISKQHVQAETVSPAKMYHQATDRIIRPGAADLARHGHPVEGMGPPLGMPSRSSLLARIVRGLAEWVADFRERRIVSSELSRMSDRDLADIGLDRVQMNAVFDPVFSRERSVRRRAGEADTDRAGFESTPFAAGCGSHSRHAPIDVDLGLQTHPAFLDGPGSGRGSTG